MKSHIYSCLVKKLIHRNIKDMRRSLQSDGNSTGAVPEPPREEMRVSVRCDDGGLTRVTVHRSRPRVAWTTLHSAELPETGSRSNTGYCR